MKMKCFIKWLRRDTPQQSIASEEDQYPVGARGRPEQKTESDYSDDSSFNWEVTDRIESSGPRKNTLIQDQCDHEDTVPHTTLKLDDDPLSGAEEDVGANPYDTAHFDAENK